ncbi:hypothetical protein Ahy_A05g023544 [Arachis hypogaea]|uniref:S-protein homolog n=1 Tax=Arachis hypogaea TaxID=3818 RepID=A0A445D3P5_ARAHY|nr:hypothetical protein Ahy_A05g023544 [Arachis hypogaea]
MTISSLSLSKVVITVSMIMLILVSSFNLNVVSSLCMILGLLICFKFNVCGSEDGIFPPLKVTVTIINNLSGGKQLTVHCKDKKNDFGFKELQVGQNWSFIFPPWFTSLYFCSFAWSTGFHYFDIYVHNRDIYRCKHCIWEFPYVIIGKSI